MTTQSIVQPPLFSNEPDTITIPLTQGQQTIVSAIDADLINLRWYAKYCSHYANGGNYQAVRNSKMIKGSRTSSIRMHRVVMSRVLNRELLKNEMVDHIDSNPLNNTRANLRLANKTNNVHNAGKRSTNTSGYKGVTWRKDVKKWASSIMSYGAKVYLGLFDTPEEAYAAYCEAAKKYHGEFANFG